LSIFRYFEVGVYSVKTWILSKKKASKSCKMQKKWIFYIFCHRKCDVHDMTMIFSRGEKGMFSHSLNVFPTFLDHFWAFSGILKLGCIVQKTSVLTQKTTKIAKKVNFFAFFVIESAVIMIWPCFFLRDAKRDVQSLSECFPDIFGPFLNIFRYFEVGVYSTKT